MFTWLFSLFANPWTLLWLPAAAIPVVIHLWNRRKYREIHWAAMEYLLAAIVKSARRMRIEQLLLLLLRTLLVLLVVFALAKPFLDTANLPFSTGTRTHRIFLIDASYSMAYQPSDKRAFDVARQRAIEIVEQGREGDGYSLILMSDTPQVVVGTATFDQAEFIEEIEKLDLVHAGADLDAGLKAVENVIQEAPQGQLARHHVYILSDLGRNTWDLATTGPAGEERAKRLERLAEQGAVEVLAIGGGQHENVAVTRLQVADSYATITNPVALTATVRNYSDQPRKGQSIELWVDGRRVDQKIEDIDAGAEIVVGFQHRFHVPGEHAVEVHITGDSLAIDNHRYLAMPVKEHLNALLVSGKRGSTYPIEAALDGGDFARGLTSTIRPESVPESKLLELDLANYDCIYLCNIGQLTANEAKALHHYVMEGGGLVTVLGDQVIPDRYNRELFERQGANETDAGYVLPAKLGVAVYDQGEEQYYFINPLEYKHPMLAKWKGNSKTGLSNVPIIKYFKLAIPDPTKADVVMALDTGDPLVVEGKIGEGRSVLVATDISTASFVSKEVKRPWSLIAAWLNSQPFIKGLWKLAVGGQISKRNVMVGEVFGDEYGRGQTGMMQVKMPDKQVVSAQSTPDDARWSFADTNTSGIYQVFSESDAPAPSDMDADLRTSSVLFAVNVDPQESDLERLDPEDLPDGFRVYETQEIDSQNSVALDRPTFALHQLLLCTILCLLFAETFLAWWIGHRSA